MRKITHRIGASKRGFQAGNLSGGRSYAETLQGCIWSLFSIPRGRAKVLKQTLVHRPSRCSRGWLGLAQHEG